MKLIQNTALEERTFREEKFFGGGGGVILSTKPRGEKVLADCPLKKSSSLSGPVTKRGGGSP